MGVAVWDDRLRMTNVPLRQSQMHVPSGSTTRMRPYWTREGHLLDSFSRYDLYRISRSARLKDFGDEICSFTGVGARSPILNLIRRSLAVRNTVSSNVVLVLNSPTSFFGTFAAS